MGKETNKTMCHLLAVEIAGMSEFSKEINVWDLRVKHKSS